MDSRSTFRERGAQFLGVLGLALGAGTLYAAWGSGPSRTAPVADCLVVPAGRPRLAADWTVDYYNRCHTRNDAYVLLWALTLVGIALVGNGYLTIKNGGGRP